jgi:hypothetical protein
VQNALGSRVAKAGDTMTGPLFVGASTGPQANLNGSASYAYSGYYRNGNARWTIQGVDPGETGGNVGSDLFFNRYTDAGVFVDSPFRVRRSDGRLIVETTDPFLNFNNTASSGVHASGILFLRNGNTRWQIQATRNDNEGGGNTGSDMVFARYNDAGTFLDVPLLITRQTGIISLGFGANGAGGIGGGQVYMRGGVSNPGVVFQQGNLNELDYFSVFYNASVSVAGSIGINTNNTSTFYNTTSDVRLKTDIEPFTQGREILDQIEIKRFNWRESGAEDVGIIAQDAHAAYPNAIIPGTGEPGDERFMPWQVDNSKYVPLLIEALQSQARRIDELEKKLQELTR